ncbi:hypothetical protein SAMN05444362_101103 [Dysgonomonas macrotermitis]|uniref:DNA polymerase-3 subunit gamma/tau n=1 Tax=Dysgonomonas macrotermitis TaxID=1346286 RepID=A0A1M4SMR4_9BACT|nr:hypothetical protein [Dysgonomonas macrotermitis]SHE33468.1 hypothetical protein SAMN05444362_101103 [Dysgonomonas macrotermitis]
MANTAISTTPSRSQPQSTTAGNNSSEKPKPTIKKPSISGLGISISALSQKSEIEEKTVQKVVEELSETFTPIQLLNEWKAYVETLTEEHHLKNTMINCLPSLLNRDTFEVVVNNPVQEQRLLDNAVSILTILRKNLRNTHIQMKVRITVDNEKKLGFTSLEKFNLMMEENESLKKLKDEFGLELL